MIKIERNRIILGVLVSMMLIILPKGAWAEDNINWSSYLEEKINEGYEVELYQDMEMLNKERVDKRQDIEHTLRASDNALPESFNTLRSVDDEKMDNMDTFNKEIAAKQQQKKQVVSNITAFRYVKHTDGSVVYSKNGLTARIEDLRIVDELGNISYENRYNFQYNDKRLLVSYEADRTDELGNVTHIKWYGAQYTPDSLWYANYETNANKNLLEYYTEEVDAAGNVRVARWEAHEYDGKLVKSFSQEIDDSVYGKTSFTRSHIEYYKNDYERPTAYYEEGIGRDGYEYSLKKENITYNNGRKNQVTGYHEEMTRFYPEGGYEKVTTDAKFNYQPIPHPFGPDVEDPDPDRIAESIITTTTEHTDGSNKTETTSTKYEYNGNNQLVGASGLQEFQGQGAKWWEFKDSQGHQLCRTEDDDGNVSYFYIDPLTNEVVFVAEEEVTATLQDGQKFNGTSTLAYEIFYGQPMASATTSTTHYYTPLTLQLIKTEESTTTYDNGLVNNFRRLLSTSQHSEATFVLQDDDGRPRSEVRDIDTIYLFAENGNLIDAFGVGTGSGYLLTDDYGWMEYTLDIAQEYEVIQGEAKQTESDEVQIYKQRVLY